MALSQIETYTIANEHLRLSVLNYGAIIKQLELKIPNQGVQSLVVGLTNPASYFKDPWFLGACCGPFAGRLAIANKVVLHGGTAAFSKQFWKGKTTTKNGHPCIELSYNYLFKRGVANAMQTTPIRVILTYTLIKNNLELCYYASSSVSIPFNLTNHSYFKLDHSNTIAHYKLQINAYGAIETKENLMPTGVVKSLDLSPLDFRVQKKIGETHLDTPYVIGKNNSFKKTATLFSNYSNISMEVFTDQEVLVCYTPKEFAGICFESGAYTDAPNQTGFPNAMVGPENPYTHKTNFKFSHPNQK